jgi:glycosyl hydrolase family 3
MVGSAPVAALLDAGHEVTALDLHAPAFEGGLPGSAAYSQADLTDAGDAFAAVRATTPSSTRPPSQTRCTARPTASFTTGWRRSTSSRRPCASRLRIPDLSFSDGSVGTRQGPSSTSMPAPLGLAASFDPKLAAKAGRLVADEVKAKGNDVLFAPTANIMRSPRGGRSFEGYGEDACLAARTGVG